MLTPGSHPDATQYSITELTACTDEAHRLGRRVAAHVLCSQGVRHSVAADVDTIEHCWSIAGGPQDCDEGTVAMLAASRSLGSVTAHRALRDLLNQGDAGLAELRRRLAPHRAMRAAGVPLPVHSDAGVPGTRFDEFHRSVEAFRLGMGTSLEEAIRASTHVPAIALGLGDRLGRIERGYAPDLIVVRGRPDDKDFSLANPLAVMISGEMIANRGKLHRNAPLRDL
jgi:imidazolonepropionase-like amidohydrolase